MTYRLALLEQHVIDHIEPAEEAVDDRPQHRVVVGVGDRDGKRRTKADAVFRAFDAVIDERSVHETLLGCELWSTIGRKMRGPTISNEDEDRRHSLCAVRGGGPRHPARPRAGKRGQDRIATALREGACRRSEQRGQRAKLHPFLLAPFYLGIFIPMPTRSPTSSRAPSPFNAPASSCVCCTPDRQIMWGLMSCIAA